jgi:hypothetical protein
MQIWNLCKSGTYAHSQSDARKLRDNKARSSLYAALKKFSLSGLRANQAGAGFSLILKPDEVVVIASQRILGLLQPIHMVPFHPKRGLASAKTYKDKSSSWLPTQQHTHGRRGKFLVCACDQGVLCFSIGRIGNHVASPLGPTIIPAQALPESENDSSWERLALLSSIRPGDFPPRPRLLG